MKTAKKNTRVDIKAMLANPIERRRMCIDIIMVCAAMEGMNTTPEQAAIAYDKVRQENEKLHSPQHEDNALELSN